ncbi:hypothetical protein BG55_01850 [Erwinia mallotivora]|uniref:Uncharacterized protein n=1 Tax=Erwinia mallotivora TaxID=69222 RepID=A0A014M5X6_9GAMM|nr:hypothetical protein BG55_01850 [Erwinia mallotivora]
MATSEIRLFIPFIIDITSSEVIWRSFFIGAASQRLNGSASTGLAARSVLQYRNKLGVNSTWLVIYSWARIFCC